PLHQVGAVLCFVVACLTIHRPVRPRLNPFRLRHAIVPLVLAWLGVALSGLGVGSGDTDVGRWWASLGLALVLAALAPFNSAIALVVFGLLSTVVCSVVAVMAFHPSSDGKALLSIIVIAALVPVQAT